MPAVPKPKKAPPRKSAGLKRSGFKRKPPKAKKKNPLKLVVHNSKNTIPADFTPAVRKRIKKRDEGKCVYRRQDGARCAQKVAGIHHVIFKSQGGLGTEDNGVCVCQYHHDWAHGLVDLTPGEPPGAGRRYFEQYRMRHLL